MEEEEPESAEELYPSLVNELESLQGEFAQLGELQEMERTYAQRVVESLKQIQEEVDVAIPVEAEALSSYSSVVKEAYLLPDAVLMLVKGDGSSESRPLIKFPPELILSVLQAATPQLKKIIGRKRKRVGERVRLLEKILKGLKKAEAVLASGAQGHTAEAEPDAITAALEEG